MEVIEFLISSGCYLQRDRFGDTPLDLAIAYGYNHIVKEIIDKMVFIHLLLEPVIEIY
jgi:ankyrin repeat protein